MLLSIVIPVYNEQENLTALHERLCAAGGSWNMDWEAVFVDDGSTDRTLADLEQLHERDPRIKVISLSRNFGHQTAVSAGLQHAAGDAVAVIDADLQDPPEELARFLEKWRDGYKVVYGIRTNRKESWPKRAAYFGFYRLLSWMASIEIPLDVGDFCLMDRTIVDALNAMPERNRFVRGLRSWLGFRQIGVPYERQARFAGSVKYTFGKLVRLAFDGMINFSYRPLQIIGTFGFIIAILSVVGIIYTLINWAFDLDFNIGGKNISDLPGYTSLILAVLFLGGVQLVTLGILGEYVGRIFDEVKGRPLYVVKRRIGLDETPKTDV